MKFFILLALFASAVSAIPHYGGHLVNTGQSAVSRSQDSYGNYNFGYNEDHATGGTFRKEKGGPGVQIGSYGLRDADGRVRVVNYVADALGFRASVSTNEPGTDVKQDPAATNLNYGGGYIPSVPVHLPLVHHHHQQQQHVYAPIAYSVATVHPAPLLHGYSSHVGHGHGELY